MTDESYQLYIPSRRTERFQFRKPGRTTLMPNPLWAALSGCLGVLAIAGCHRQPATYAAPPNADVTQQTSAADIRSDPLRQAYFGELHLHTA